MRQLILISLFVSCLLSTTMQASKPVIRLNAILNNAAVLKINGQQHMLQLNTKSPEGYRLISLRDDHVVLDMNGIKRQIKLGASIGSYQARKKVQVQIANNDGMYFVNGKINHGDVKFLVDTGASTVALSSEAAKKLGIDYLNNGVRGKSLTAGGEVSTWQVSLANVNVGGISLNNVEADIIEGEHPKVALLGMSFLNQTRMVNDGVIMMLERVR